MKHRIVWVMAALAIAIPAFGQSRYENVLKNLKFREIGPAIMGGRTDDFAVVESNPSIIYAGTASAGVWKTINAGVTWEPIFERQPVSTIGDITVAPSDPSIVWVGTGEQNNRQSSSWGNGVYKSMDGGKTWTHLGLKDTHHIGRIVIHPTDPNIVYVAALGHLWGPNAERGVFKTTDGGKTWMRSLFINDDTGVVDIAMDLQSPNTLYAGAYQRRRTPFGYNGGGPHSALYKTTDGGATWRKLGKGLPETGDTGRIGIDIYRRNPNVVYALIEHARLGGIYRSNDKGETWTRMSDTNPRPSYYSQIHIDPNNDQRVWVLGAPMYYTEDGGKTFNSRLVSRIHGDYHAMWIDPANSDHMLVGSDGGIHQSWDRGRTWDYINTLALGQFYEIGFDMRKPYYVCGGLQDNGSWCGPSATLFQQGITNEDWYRIGGGDGFYAQIDPTDHNIVYTESQDGNLSRRDLRTNEARNIRPEPKEGEPRYRFQWNSPIVVSAHGSKTIYYGGNFLFKSANRGDTWEKLGGDLTTGVDRNKLSILGKVPDRDTLSRNDGVQAYPCITTISESPLQAGILWVGTDDGNVQVTRDSGRTWRNVVSNARGVPKGTYVSRVVASRFSADAAYVTFDGHRGDDYKPYVFLASEYGGNWKSIASSLTSEDGTVHVIREHIRNSNLLFLGTEFGFYVTWDRGGSWHKVTGNLPTVPVDDIAIHPRENDLILGTHGRSVWIMDDLTPLEQLADKVMNADLHLFDTRPATAWRIYGHKGNTGHKFFIAQNPPYGALINYYLKSKLDDKDRVRITVTDKSGKLIRELNGTKDAGLNRVNWDLRYTAPTTAPAGPTGEASEEQPAIGGGGGGGFFFGGGRGPMVEPGEYTVKIVAGSAQDSKTIKVEEDTRITISAADRAARQRAVMQLYDLAKRADEGRRTVSTLRTQLTSAMDSWKRPGAARIPDEVQKSAAVLSKKVDEVNDKFVAPLGALGAAGPPLVQRPTPLPQRIGRLMSAIDGYTAAPTAQQEEEIGTLSKLLDQTLAEAKKLVDEDLPALNKKMNEAGVAHITLERSEAAPPTRRRR